MEGPLLDMNEGAEDTGKRCESLAAFAAFARMVLQRMANPGNNGVAIMKKAKGLLPFRLFL